jgi:hypothetical protein
MKSTTDILLFLGIISVSTLFFFSMNSIFMGANAASINSGTNSSDEIQQIIRKPPKDRYEYTPPVVPALQPIVPAIGQPLDLSNNMGNSYYPNIAVSGSNVFVICYLAGQYSR